MTRTFAFVLFLVYAGCDVSPASEEADVTFQATVQTRDETRALRGTARLDDRDGEAVVTDSEGLTITSFLLASDETPDVIRLVGVTRGPLEPGSYDVSLVATPPGQGGDTGPFLALYDVDNVLNGEGVAEIEGFGQSGVVEIVEVTDRQITGRFDVSFLGGPAGPGGVTESEGTFEVRLGADTEG